MQAARAENELRCNQNQQWLFCFHPPQDVLSMQSFAILTLSVRSMKTIAGGRQNNIRKKKKSLFADLLFWSSKQFHWSGFVSIILV